MKGDILENNRLLAEFLEFKKVEYYNNYHAFIIPDYLAYHEYKNLTLENNNEVVAWDAENLLFHKNWNWLMNVVEKIESLNYAVYIQTRSTRIESEDGKLMFWFFVGQSEDGKYEINSKIEAVYNTCVEFVKNYNKTIK